jgi:hypothetical protein
MENLSLQPQELVPVRYWHTAVLASMTGPPKTKFRERVFFCCCFAKVAVQSIEKRKCFNREYFATAKYLRCFQRSTTGHNQQL